MRPWQRKRNRGTTRAAFAAGRPFSPSALVEFLVLCVRQLMKNSVLEEKSRWRKRLRFGLRGLLLLVVAAAMLSASYRLGYVRGRQDGPVIPSTINFYRIYSREYSIADLASSPTETEQLAAAVRRSAAPDTWDVVGGYATMEVSTSEMTLAVEYSFSGHVSIVEYLSDLRRSQNGRSKVRLAELIREVDRGRGQRESRTEARLRE